ncbi:DEAD/DEAH box helicase [Nocardia niigatensis]|uniref:DEAD/DEAH box helicase n=1 Tax=Nocardia niigatensis TaxID=209249 RepID=UPI001FE12DFB|nr:DEAD/DEAH box helicase [Nocardia niigatensis]
MRSSPEAKVRFYLDLFRCRDDVYAVRWENRRDGRSGWMPAIRGRWSKGMSRSEALYLPLTNDVIARHLRGDHHVGLYPLTDDDTCWWVAADFDKSAAMLDALAFLKAARAKDIPAALEVSQSGRGAHVWIFFAGPTPAATARRIATGLLAEAIQLRGSMNLSSYDRLFPSQDTHTGRGMGNLIAALLALLTTLVESADSTLNIDDNRTDGSEQTFTWASELRAEQQTALRAVEAQETCVLIAPPGTGKTVIACAAIASRATSTLILVDRKALADQWRTRILEHLGIKCGQIGGGRSKTTGVIDVALLPTLARRANVDELTRGYGFVVVDECHHIAASAFTDVLNQIPARYWLGLTATPYRRDQLDDLIYHQLGSHTHTIDAPAADHLPTSGDAPAPHRILHVHPTRFAYDGDADPSQPGGIAEIYRALVADEERLKQIVTDVLDAHQAGANILVLTTWVDHVDALTEHLTAAGCEDIIVLRGGMKARERQAVIESIATRVASGSPLLLVGTGSYIGEGFDCPALDTLFLAAPVSFKGRLVQYAGRITRAHPGKTTATVHDYHDVLTPVIASSLRKRAPGYAELGFPDPRKLGN